MLHISGGNRKRVPHEFMDVELPLTCMAPLKASNEILSSDDLGMASHCDLRGLWPRRAKAAHFQPCLSNVLLSPSCCDVEGEE